MIRPIAMGNIQSAVSVFVAHLIGISTLTPPLALGGSSCPVQETGSERDGPLSMTMVRVFLGSHNKCLQPRLA